MSFIFKFREGFSLLEMAVVLIVIGLISGAALPLLTLQNQRTSMSKTREHQEYVVQALATYFVRHKSLPCPGDPGAGPERFGLKGSMPETLACAFSQGIVPFRTLGIAERWVKDGFGHYMTYVPERQFLDEGVEMERICDYQGGSLKITDARGTSALTSDPGDTNFIAVILISHGPLGRGAFLGNGTPVRFEGERLIGAKGENANNDRTFSEYVMSADEAFDDVLRWESRDQFLSHYAGVSCTPGPRERSVIRNTGEGAVPPPGFPLSTDRL